MTVPDPIAVLREGTLAFKNMSIFHGYPESIPEDMLAALDALVGRAEAAEAIARNAHGHIQRALTERDRALGMAERLERLADLYAHRLREHPRNCQWCRMEINEMGT